MEVPTNFPMGLSIDVKVRVCIDQHPAASVEANRAEISHYLIVDVYKCNISAAIRAYFRRNQHHGVAEVCA